MVDINLLVPIRILNPFNFYNHISVGVLSSALDRANSAEDLPKVVFCIATKKISLFFVSPQG